jgi:hypothetical protein
MRGTSQREDGAFWVVQVLKTHSRKDRKKETLFPIIFEKNRENHGNIERNLDWLFITKNGPTQVTCTSTDMRVLVYDLIKDDIELCSDLAKELGITKGIVTKYATEVS